MKNARTLHVLTDSKGTIIGAGYIATIQSEKGPVDARIEPLKGQRLVAIDHPEQLPPLSSAADFERFTAQYCVQPGKSELKMKSKRPVPRRQRIVK